MPPKESANDEAPEPFSPLLSPRSREEREAAARKHQVYLLFEDIESSTMAMFVIAFVMLCIVCSTAAFCVETVPGMERYERIFFYLEVFFVTVFSLEYVLRFWASVPEKMSASAFILNPMNVIDLLAILPFFVDLFMTWYYKGSGLEVDLRLLRALRLFRLFKIGRYSTQLKLIATAMSRSSSSLIMLGVCMIFAIIIFSTLMFLVERGTWDPSSECYVRLGERAGVMAGTCSPFQSIPEASWWAITTMTTVGYGDTFPITDGGRFIGGITMVIGILCVALPTTVLGVQFTDSFAECVEEKAITDLKAKLKKKKEKDRGALPGGPTRYELDKGMKKLDKIEEELKELLPQVHRDLLVVTQFDARKNSAVKIGFPTLTEPALQSIQNAKTYLKECTST